MDIISSLEQSLAEGRVGGNVGRDIRSPKLSRLISGLQLGRLGLVGGQSGTGKTSFVDDHFVFQPLEEWMHVMGIDMMNPPDIRDVVVREGQLDVEIEYYSMEISPMEKMIKYISRRIYFDHGIPVSSDYILGRLQDDKGQPILPSPEINAMVDTYMPLVRFLLKKIKFHERKITKEYITQQRKLRHGRNGEFEEYEGELIYHRYNPKKMVLDIFDHAGLIKKGKDGKKSTLDDISADSVDSRNVCKESTIFISQFNRGIEDVQRAKLGVEPQAADFKDTGNLYEDADWVFALFHPYKFKMGTYLPDENGRSYNTQRLRDFFRAGFLLKNRYGAPDKVIPYHFVGASGITDELPPPGELAEEDYQRLLLIR